MFRGVFFVTQNKRQLFYSKHVFLNKSCFKRLAVKLLVEQVIICVNSFFETIVSFFLLQTVCIIFFGLRNVRGLPKCVKVCYLGGSGVRIDVKLR